MKEFVLLVQMDENDKITKLYEAYKTAKDALYRALEDEGMLQAKPADKAKLYAEEKARQEGDGE